MLVFRLLVAAILEEGAEDYSIGGEGCEEDVEGGDEGTEVLIPAVVYHHGNLVAGKSHADDGKRHAEDDADFPVAFVSDRKESGGGGHACFG